MVSDKVVIIRKFSDASYVVNDRRFFMSNNTIIKFSDAASQTSGDITRVVGFIPAKFVLPLFQSKILDANPRKPKVSRVTSDIMSTLEETPELFQFKSKGILIGTSNFEQLQRNRYRLEFSESGAEGILDGGHNMLSIGLHLIEPFYSAKEMRQINDWDKFLEAYKNCEDEIKEKKDEYNFNLSAELIIPSSADLNVVENFRIASIDICAARNNNAALKQEAKAHQRGFYDELKSRLEKKHPSISARVEWKTNEWESDDKRPIRVRDLVTLLWIPLSVLAENEVIPKEFRLNPKQLYSSKGKLSQEFDNLMETDGISRQQADGKYELTSTAVGSAIELMCDFPDLVDWIYANFSSAYNDNGTRRIGGITAVSKRNTFTPYLQNPMDYAIPDGFIIPLIYGLKALIGYKEGKVFWTTEPLGFLKSHFKDIVSGFVMPIEMAGKDPQKVGKSDQSYDFAFKQYQFSNLI